MLAPDSVKKLLHLLLYSVVTVILASMFILASRLVRAPLLGVWGLLICPLPLAILGCRDGGRAMAWGLLLTELLLTVLFSINFAIYFLVGHAPLSLAIYTVAGTRWKVGEALLACTLTSLGMKLVLVAVGILLVTMGQVPPPLNYNDPNFYAGLPPELIPTARLLPYTLPSLFLILAGLDAFINYKLCVYFLRRRPHLLLSQRIERCPPVLPPFSNWRLPWSLLPAFMLAMLLGRLWDTKTWLTMAMFAVNLKVVLGILLFIQGVSLVLWWMKRYNFFLTSRILVFLFIVLFLPMWILIILLGVCDIAFNFRLRTPKIRG